MTTPPRGKSSGLRLRLRRRPDPVLTEDELDFINDRLEGYIQWAKGEQAAHIVAVWD